MTERDAGPAGLSIRLMSVADIPEGQRLREQAGWNQSDDDWRRLLAWEPGGCFVAELDGRIVATTTTTTYARTVAWVGMVLVEETRRGQGIGRAMLGRALGYLDAQGVTTVGLDSTPEGKPLYERLGFVERYTLERWRGIVSELRPGRARPIETSDLDAVVAFDASAAGLDRGHILQALHAGTSGSYLVNSADGQLAGYLFTRPGARALHVGPLVARDGRTADDLVSTALRHLAGREMLMDILMPNPASVALANRLGLRSVRTFMRMTRGAPPPVDTQRVYTSAGPEIG